MNVEYPIPNEDIIRLAEKEEPRFLHILLKDKDSLRDAIAFGIKRTKSGSPGHFLIPKNNLLYAMIHDNYVKYGTLLTRGSMDSILDSQNSGSDEDKASMKSHWDKIWNRHDVSISDYQLVRDHMNDRFVVWQFYDKWKRGDEIIKATIGHANQVKEFIKGINSITNLEVDPYSLTVSMDQGIKDAMDFVTSRREHPEKNDTIRCGIEAIDGIYNGFERGSYTVVSGLVNGGKTTLMMNMGFNMAKAGYNVAYVSLEKKASVFFRKLLSLHAATDYNRIKRGGTESWGLSDVWYQKLLDAAKDLIENIKPHYDCLQFVQKTKLTAILAEVDRLRSQKKIDVLVVDYLQVIGFETSHSSRPDLDLADIHQRLMAYGRTHNIAIITALQIKSSSSKEIRKKASKVSTEVDVLSLGIDPEDYAGSQMVVADADNAMGVVMNGDRPPTKMFVSISKARDDESRRILTLDFDGKICRCSDPICDASQITTITKELYSGKTEEKSDDLFGSVQKGSVITDKKGEEYLDAITSNGMVKPAEVKKEDVSEVSAENLVEEAEEIEEQPEQKPSGNVEVADDSDDYLDFK